MIVLTLSTFMFKRAAGSLSLTKPNMISYIYYFPVICMSFIGSILIILKLDNHYVISRVSDVARLYGWLAVMYTMLTFPIGLLFSKFLWIGRKKANFLLDEYTKRKINVSNANGNALKYSIFIFTVVSALSCLYTFYSIGYFPLLKGTTSPAQELTKLRIDSSIYFNGNVYIKNILALSLMPILSYAWLFYYIETKRQTCGLMFAITFFLSLSILYFDFSKAPILWYILSFIFAFFYAKGEFKKVPVMILGCCALLILILMYSLSGTSVNDIVSYNTGPIGRVLLGQVAGTFYMFDIFPFKYDFIGFSSTSQLLSNIFNFDYIERAARITMMDFNPKGVENGTVSLMNSLFIAEAWANFGLFGVLISPLWVGFLIGSLYYLLLNLEKNPIFLAALVNFSYGGSFVGGFNDYYYNINMVVVISIILLLYLLARLFQSSIYICIK